MLSNNEDRKVSKDSDGNKAKIGEFIKGKGTKEQHLKYFFILIALFLGSIICAQITFPGGYSIAKYYISDMGSLTQNPHGWFFYDVAAALFALLIIPHILYIHRRMMNPPIAAILVYLQTFLCFVGSTGLFLVAITPNSIVELEHVHNLGSTLAFGGYGFAALISMLTNLIRVIKKAPHPDPYAFVVGYGLLILVATNILRYCCSIQQWSGFFSVMTWFIVLSIMI